MKIRGSRVLITGATGGVGRATCRRLAAAGADLLLTARDPEPLEALAGEFEAEWAASDLALPGGVEPLLGRWPEIDVLISAAAVHGSGPLTALTKLEVEDVVAIDLLATLRLTHGLIPGMIDRDCGHIVVISSLSGIVGFPGASLYSTAKFGLRGFADGLRADTRGTGVTVSTIMPGFIRDEGMIARAGVALPWWLPTSTADDVASAIVSSIGDSSGEVVVGPLAVRALGRFGRGFPGPSRWAARRAVNAMKPNT